MSDGVDAGRHQGYFDSIRVRLFLAIVSATLPIMGGLGFYVWHQYQGLIESSDRAASNLAQAVAAYDTSVLNDARGVLVALSNTPLLRAGRWSECSDFFALLLERLPRYLNLGVIDAQGRAVCSGLRDPAAGGSYLGDRDYYQRAVRDSGAVLGRFQIGRIARDKPTLVVALNAADLVVYASLNLDFLHEVSAVSGRLPGTQLWVLDRGGQVLLHLGDAKRTQGERLEGLALPADRQPRTTTVDTPDGRIWRRFSVAAGVDGDLRGLSVHYDVPVSVLYAPARQALWAGVLAGFLLLCLAVLAAWSLMQLAAGHSLEHLRRALRRVGQQDFSTRVAKQLRGRELREIGEQFDTMSDKLRNYQQSLQQSEQSYRLLFEGSPNAMLVLGSASGKFLAINDQAIHLYGYDREAFLQLGLSDLRVEVGGRRGDTPFSFEQHRRSDGQQLSVEMRSLPTLLEFDGQLAYVIVIRDLTQQEALSRDLRERNRLLGQLMDVTVEAILGLDPEGRCIFANRACLLALGYERPDEVIGQHFHRLAHDRHEDGSPYAEQDCPILRTMQGRTHIHVDDEVLWRRDGRCFPVEYWAYPIWRGDTPDLCLVTFLDISERRAQQRALEHQATHDPLTGLYNRGEILRRLRWSATRRPDVPWVLVMSNLDGFKEVNEGLGHDVGDRLLREAASRFGALVDDECLVGRVGGDEFAFVFMRMDLARARACVRKLLAAAREPFMLSELPVRISASFGLVRYPDHAADPDDLIRYADIAMRRAKRDGVGLAVFDPRAGAQARDRLLLRGELRAALNEDQFELHLQPKIALNVLDVSGWGTLAPGSPVGFEALVRWQHPHRGLIMPDRFVSILEVSDLVHPFTHWVIDRAVAACAQWRALAPMVGVAANVSTRNLLDVHLPDQVRAILRRYDLPAGLLELEVTESAIMADPTHALATLHRLHDLGVQLAVDDFGTGYSSFAYLKRLPIDAVKIDRSFVSGMATDADLQAIVRSIIGMAHTLGLRVIAEGVETPVVMEMLRDMGCDAGQGYGIGRPTTVDQARSWLETFARTKGVASEGG